MTQSALRLFHVQCGSNGGPDRLLQLVMRPPYNLALKGVMIEEIPKHASHLIVTGMVTRNMLPILGTALMQMKQRRIILLGEFDCFDREQECKHPLYRSPAFAPVPGEWKEQVILRIIHDPLLPFHVYEGLMSLL